MFTISLGYRMVPPLVFLLVFLAFFHPNQAVSGLAESLVNNAFCVLLAQALGVVYVFRLAAGIDSPTLDCGETPGGYEDCRTTLPEAGTSPNAGRSLDEGDGSPGYHQRHTTSPEADPSPSDPDPLLDQGDSSIYQPRYTTSPAAEPPSKESPARKSRHRKRRAASKGSPSPTRPSAAGVPPSPPSSRTSDPPHPRLASRISHYADRRSVPVIAERIPPGWDAWRRELARSLPLNVVAAIRDYGFETPGFPRPSRYSRYRRIKPSSSTSSVSSKPIHTSQESLQPLSATVREEVSPPDALAAPALAESVTTLALTDPFKTMVLSSPPLPCAENLVPTPSSGLWSSSPPPPSPCPSPLLVEMASPVVVYDTGSPMHLDELDVTWWGSRDCKPSSIELRHYSPDVELATLFDKLVLQDELESMVLDSGSGDDSDTSMDVDLSPVDMMHMDVDVDPIQGCLLTWDRTPLVESPLYGNNSKVPSLRNQFSQLSFCPSWDDFFHDHMRMDTR